MGMNYENLSTSDLPGDVALLIRTMVRQSDPEQNDAVRALIRVAERDQISYVLADRIRDNAMRVIGHSVSSNKPLFVQLISACIWNHSQVDGILRLAYSEKDENVLREIVLSSVRLAGRFPLCQEQVRTFLLNTVIGCECNSTARLAAELLNGISQKENQDEPR